jgi:hypothetical protein
MEDVDLDPLTWEAYLPSMADADTRIEFGIVEAEYAKRMQNQASAGVIAAIHRVLEEARDTPSIFVGPSASADNRSDVEFAVRAAVSDLAVRLAVAEMTVIAHEHQAEIMIARTPLTWRLFRLGDISPANAKTVSDLAFTLPYADASVHARFDEAVADLAVRLAPPRFRARARAIREKLVAEASTDTTAERHQSERAFRRVYLEPDIDGMAWLHAYLPADTAIMTMGRLDEEATDRVREPHETRTMAQLRADFLGEILLGVESGVDGSGSAPRVGVTVGLLVPVLTLLGLDDQPASLEGYGPIDAATARRLTATAPSFYRILTHPITGTILDIDKTTLRIPADMRRWLQVRDQTCIFPGCGKRAKFCELDHTVDRQFGGVTKVNNLAHLCKKHHREKHHTRWTAQHLPNGNIQWTSPTGHVSRGDPPPF